ncbi:MAG: hypothetical protein OXF94_12815 [Gammaproteobacteria bacterium]|nr:hypothetical protein [Gammaproteobacteria bacterium]
MRGQILLSEALSPAESDQHLPDQVVFGLAFAGLEVRGEAVEYSLQVGLKFVDFGVLNGGPIGKFF